MRNGQERQAKKSKRKEWVPGSALTGSWTGKGSGSGVEATVGSETGVGVVSTGVGSGEVDLGSEVETEETVSSCAGSGSEGAADWRVCFEAGLADVTAGLRRLQAEVGCAGLVG